MPSTDRSSNLPLALLGGVLLAGCAGAPVPPTSDPVNAQAQADYARALWALKAGRTEEGQTLLVELTQRHPTLAGPYLNLGILHLQSARAQEAEQALRAALARNPDNPVAYNHLGIACRQLGRFQDAMQAYLNALRLDPDYANAHLNLGILYDLYLGDPARALGHYQSYQRLRGDADQEVAKWIVDAERRAESPPGAGA